ncbi:MAG: DUF2007 domain-containing protein [Endozoicomonas sp.]
MLVTIARFSFPYEAHLARGLLEVESIPAFVADEHTVSMNWLYSNALGGVRLQVPARFGHRAREVIMTRHNENESLFDDYVGTCSHCGGKRLQWCLLGKRRAFIMFWLVQFPLYPVAEAYRCRDCGRMSQKNWLVPGLDCKKQRVNRDPPPQ